jgi:hypothetical protein
MPKLVARCIAISLDGFSAAKGQALDAPFGKDGLRPPVLPHVILLPNASRMMLPAALILGMLDSILSMLTKAQSDADGVRSSASD